MSNTQPDTVVELDLGATPAPGSSKPVLMQTDTTTLLGFNAVNASQPAGTAIIAFDQCLISKLGHPNDQALGGHPLYPKELGFYGIYEVLKPTWLTELDDQNRQSFPNHNSYNARHFIVTFHDSTFECLARDISFDLLNIDRSALHTYLADRLTS